MSSATETLLNFDALLHEARETTGLHDFGNDSFRVGLRQLIETYRGGPERPGLTLRGQRRQHRRLVSLLCTRLKLEDAWKRTPGLDAADIVSPIVVVGLPRTGTSALFNLLASTPGMRPLYFWEGRNPDPLPAKDPHDAAEEDPRLTALRATLDAARAKNPEFSAIHEVRADGPEECVTLMELAFDGAQQGIEPLMEPYASWFRGHDLLPMYRYFRRLLNTLQNQRPGTQWLLKCPAHLWALDELFTIFPDARVVQTHRDPAVSVPSYCSMIEALMANRPAVDREQLGADVLDYLATSVDRASEARARLEAQAPGRFFDVHYDTFVADPAGTAHALLIELGVPLADSAAEALTSYADGHQPRRLGAHAYSLSTYGLNQAQVRARFDTSDASGLGSLRSR